MYICNHCGCVAEDLHDYQENHGLPYYSERVVDYDCPFCGWGEMVEADECAYCGEAVANDELHSGICKDCLLREIEDDETATMYLAGLREDFYVEWCYDSTTDNPALIELCEDAFWRRPEKERISLLHEFIENDFDYFAEWLTQKERKAWAS